jgi:hypothetical protein
MRLAIILPLALCSCASDKVGAMRQAAENLNDAASECLLDVRDLAFAESRHCARVPSLYRAYGQAKDAAKSSAFSDFRSVEIARIDNKALNANIKYAWAFSSETIIAPHGYRHYYNAEFVSGLNKKLGKPYRERKKIHSVD